MNVNSAKGKPAEIVNILDYTKPDVIVMSETKLDKSCYTSEFLPKNYTAFRRDRTINGGGVLIATKKGLVADEVYFKELGKDCELMCVRVSTCSKMPSLYVCAYYRPQTDNTPNTSLDSLKSALDQIEQLAGQSKSTLVVTGDFNCPNIDWDSMSLIQGNTIPKVCDKLIDVMAQSGLTQMQRETTKLDSILDLFFTNSPGLVTSIGNTPGVSTASEHEAIIADIKLRAQYAKKHPHKIFKWSAAPWERLKKETSDFTEIFMQRFATSTGNKTDSSGIAPLKEDGQVYSNAWKKADILAKQFRSVFTIDQDKDVDTTLHGPSCPPLPDLAINEEGVLKLPQGIDPRKASGPDEIPCRLLSGLAGEIAPAFTKLFQQSYNDSTIQDVWRAAWITPVFKKGAKFEASNYRPVSLTCVACKLMEHIITSHIRSHLETHGLIHPNQHGFMKRRHCESQLLMTTHDFLTRLDKKHAVDIAVLDFSKAFDSVPHKRLIRKLRLYGIEGRNLAWISSFLHNRTQSVVVDGVRSHSGSAIAGDPVVSGVPQGTVLGPLLFLLFINDLPHVLDPGTECRLYADDCLIYRSIHCQEDKVTLQKDLDALHDWSNSWGLYFNVSKYNMLHLARQVEKPCRFYSLGGDIIKSVSEATYLGVTLSNKFGSRSSHWDAHITSVVASASQRLGFLRRNLRGSPYRMRELAFEALVRSTLNYCGSIWDPSVQGEIRKLEMIQNRGARWVRGARGVISVTALLRDLGWLSLADQRRNQRLCLFYKLLNNIIDVNICDLDIRQLKDTDSRKSRGYHPNKLVRQRASDKSSPLWTSTVFRTIPQWNNLSTAALEAGSITTFKSQLSPRP